MATPTPNLGLTQYSGTEDIDFLTEYNTDMVKIDTAVGTINTNISGLDTRVDALETTTTSLDTRVDALEIRDDDYVVDEGTSGIWKYTKWHSGKCEIDGIVSVAYDTGSAFGTGGLYFHKTTGTIAYPFTINGAKACICKQDAVISTHCGTILATGDFYFYVLNTIAGTLTSASAGNWRVNIVGTYI